MIVADRLTLEEYQDYLKWVRGSPSVPSGMTVLEAFRASRKQKKIGEY